MRDTNTIRGGRLAIPLAAAFAVTALGAGTAMAQDEPAYAGLDKDLSGITIKMAAIGGGNYEAMYDSISMFEEATGANVEIVYLGDGFEIDRYLKTNYAAGTVDFDVAWNHTSFMSQFTNFVEPLQNWFTEEELAAFSPAIIEAATIDGDLQLNFAEKIDCDLMAAKDFHMATLPTEALHVHHGEPKDFDFGEGLLDRLEFGWLDDGNDQFHSVDLLRPHDSRQGTSATSEGLARFLRPRGPG